MTTKIDKKITGYAVIQAMAKDGVLEQVEPVAAAPEIQQMHEGIERPEVLVGMTYKIKSPLVEHALYVTINDIVLNEGTDHETRRPFEIFINSKSMEHFQWIVGFTRILSAVFRKGGDIVFVIDEMRSVFDPNGGYYKSGGKFMPSLIAEIGQVVEDHLVAIGTIEREDKGAAAREMMKQKLSLATSTQEQASTFPDSATLCVKCNTKALVILDGCQTCLNCGESKCG